MNTTRLLLTTLACSAAFAGPLFAADGTVPLRSGLTTSHPLVSVLDLDRDGVIAAAEMANAPITLRALDLNDDGSVSPSEMLTSRSAAQVRRGNNAVVQPVAYRPSSELNVLVHLDANSDGTLQPMEIANAASSLHRLDVNRDGVLTREEVRPVRRA